MPSVFLEVNGEKAREAPGKGLLTLLRSKKFSDLTFLVDGKPLKVHRNIVASQSSYFER